MDSLYDLRIYDLESVDNDFDPMTPEWWAEEGLVRFEENLFASQTFSRDYDEDFARPGEVINLHRVGTSVAHRKPEQRSIELTNQTSEDVQVKLNQHVYTAFSVSDREIKRNVGNLIDKYIIPNARAMAEAVDLFCQSQMYQWYFNTGGTLGSSVTYSDLVDTNRRMDTNNAPLSERTLIVGPTTKADLLNTDKLTEYRMTEDGGPILNGFLTRGSSFDIVMSQTSPEIIDNMAKTMEAVNGNHPVGATTISISEPDADIPTGSWILIAGDDVPQRVVTGADESASNEDIVIAPGLRRAVDANAEVQVFTPGVVDTIAAVVDERFVDGTTILAGYDGPIPFDAFSNDPQVSQGVSFGDGGHVYGIWKVGDGTIILSEPLVSNVAQGAAINLMPPGNYNMAIRPEAATLVNRPMDLPSQSVSAALAQFNNLSLRVIMSYDHKFMAHVVSLDALFGFKVLDPTQGAILLGG